MILFFYFICGIVEIRCTVNTEILKRDIEKYAESGIRNFTVAPVLLLWVYSTFPQC